MRQLNPAVNTNAHMHPLPSENCICAWSALDVIPHELSSDADVFHPRSPKETVLHPATGGAREQTGEVSETTLL